MRRCTSHVGARSLGALVPALSSVISHSRPVSAWQPRALVEAACVQVRAVSTPANPPPPPMEVSEGLRKDLQEMINRDRIVIFMTGTPAAPRCRFTALLMDMINQLGFQYSYVNILDDDEVCEGLKVFSGWPTYPQVYVDGTLIGGYDVVKAMMLSGELTKLLKEKGLI